MMKKENCIFCRIAKGEIPSVKIWEDKEFLAILDVFPNTEGMTLIIPKKHYDSYLFDLPEEFYKRFMMATRKIAKILEKGLKVRRVAMIMEGMEINHLHMKIYPLHGLKNKFSVMAPEEEKYFENYEGYLTTLSGPKKSMEELEKIAERIRGI